MFLSVNSVGTGHKVSCLVQRICRFKTDALGMIVRLMVMYSVVIIQRGEVGFFEFLTQLYIWVFYL